MVKKCFNLSTLLLVCIAYGQVGINTTQPKATMDITSSSTSNIVNGLLVPRLSALQIDAMLPNLNQSHHSLLIFATEPRSNSNFPVSKIDGPGYYRFNYSDDVWQRYFVKMEPSGFENVTQSGKSGKRLIGAAIGHYGQIGQNAVDASFSNQTGGFNGATGDYSFSAGYNNISSAKGAVSFGEGNAVQGENAFAFGKNNRAGGINSSASGTNNQSTRFNTVAFGELNVSQADNSSILAGKNNTITNSVASAILTGRKNTVHFTGSAESNSGFSNNILGGDFNNIIGSFLSGNTIVNGAYNRIQEGSNSFIGGGTGNKIRPSSTKPLEIYYDSNVISGGSGNEINADISVIAGGVSNLIRIPNYNSSIVGAGVASILGGQYNSIVATYSSIIGGKGNRNTGTYSITGGLANFGSSVAEVSLGLFGTTYTPQYNDRYTGTSGPGTNNMQSSKDRLFNLGNGYSNNFGSANWNAQSGNYDVAAIRSDAFTVLKNGQVGINISNFETNTTDAKLEINGGIKISASQTTLASNVCDNSNRGTVIFVDDNFYGCKSSGWVQLNN